MSHDVSPALELYPNAVRKERERERGWFHNWRNHCNIVATLNFWSQDARQSCRCHLSRSASALCSPLQSASYRRHWLSQAALSAPLNDGRLLRPLLFLLHHSSIGFPTRSQFDAVFWFEAAPLPSPPPPPASHYSPAHTCQGNPWTWVWKFRRSKRVCLCKCACLCCRCTSALLHLLLIPALVIQITLLGAVTVMWSTPFIERVSPFMCYSLDKQMESAPFILHSKNSTILKQYFKLV